jgi:predicted O-linked N-acetylglucosamine transferase (SPINDLY family)
MATISEALSIAIQHHQAGRLQAAEQIYRQILQADPRQADAMHLLGVIASQVGQYAVAVEYIGRAIALNGNEASFHQNLAAAYQALQRIPEAIASARRAVQLKPDYAEAYNSLGIALNDQGKPEEAVACCRRALELKPDFVQALNNLGNALNKQGKLDEAAACYRRVLERFPDLAEVHNNLGNALKDQGNLDEAVACFHRALELKPDYAEAHNNLGNALNHQGKPEEAIACYRRALELKPDLAEAHNNLGIALMERGSPDEAAACCRRALELKPEFTEAHNNLACALKDQGKPEEAIACCRRALELKPQLAEAHSNLLLTLHYCPGVTPAALAEAHAEFDRRHAASLGSEPAKRTSAGDRHDRLRLGFVSPDLVRHPVGYFLVRVLENLDREAYETICYSDRFVKDDLTHRLQAAASQWREVLGISDQKLAEQIRADRVDVLFDLAGHTARNRMLVFARKPAPVQITWIGYEGTTGLAAMDYLLADRWVVPQGAEPYYREKVLRMPDGYLCYDPPQAAPPEGPPPSLAKGSATFGSFNNLAKITPEVVAVWAKILRRVPHARLVLKYRGLGDPMVQRRYFDLFAAQGVQPQRLQLQSSSPYAEYLAAYQQVDVALDPFPFSGSITTCEALWMGVPVVTCPGETFASRHTLSHLANLGLTEMVARDCDQYVELAVSLAADVSRLAELRAGLRPRMAASPLCDGKRFTRGLASLLRDLWEARSE